MPAASESVTFYKYPQDVALSTFLPILRPHLPLSNPLYNRLRAPQNIPSRHCLFAATFPPSNAAPETYTILFADRSRHLESQIWIFNPIIMETPESAEFQNKMFEQHLQVMVVFLKNTAIPEAPGWPFQSMLKFACLHETIARTLISIAERRNAMLREIQWNFWIAPTRASETLAHKRLLPEGFSITRVPEDQLDIVLSTSLMPRQKVTMLELPNVGILDLEQKLAGWGYIGIDGSLMTLYVLEKYRGLGFATYVAKELLSRLGKGEFKNLGFEGETSWIHSNVKMGNEGSEGVMRSIGGKVHCVARYVGIDCDKF